MSSRTILVVDDYGDLRRLVASFLRARGYQVLQASTGKAAVQITIGVNPNLLLIKAELHDCIQKPISFRELEAVI